MPGKWFASPIVAFAAGGTEQLTNCEILCPSCHARLNGA